ncbi:ABC transporter ATP-binding protein [Sedimentibacter sp.]|uniref:ABC transporter ATP-binding protein n=1 Tax=Sedimentibacter sp. TaxID=1960295 RepID=UPI002896D987|nr:ABC transporter ATP-binding protein [Sedimentibacter sp.]
MKKLVEVKNLFSYYGGICALNGVSLYINEGEITSIVGSNGAGKSTLMRTIAGDKRIDSGEIIFNEQSLPGNVYEVVVSGISLVPEGRHIFPALSVRENLILGTCALKGTEYKRAVNETMEEVLTLFPILGKRIRQSGGTLSGGEQQMLAIGRALMAHPKLLCLDEPSLGLAPIIIDEVFDKIQQLNKEKGLTVLLVEQNAYLALDVADRAYVLNTGLIALEGTGQELADDPSVQEEYLGIKS